MQNGFEVVNLHGTASGVIAVPTIGENGNWWIGNEDTGVSSRGERGDSAESGRDAVLVEGNFSAVQADTYIPYPENFAFGNCYIRSFNILGKSGYVTLSDNGVFVQLRKDGIYLTSGVHEKYRGYSVLLELAKKMSESIK